MIETMILKVKEYLPLKISEVNWDNTSFQMFGPGWNFNTLSSWRISTNYKMILGCVDNDSDKVAEILKNCAIIDIQTQDHILKIDPTFILSNDLKLEIFSTDTFEPWTFKIERLGLLFCATPSEPTAFNP